MPTGVDRVELAYLHHLAQCPEPLFAIARTTLGYALLGADGISQITRRIDGTLPWGLADRLSKLARSKPHTVRQAESDLRRFALDRCRPRQLPKMLARYLPVGVSYVNTGHSNLTERMLWAVRHGAKGRVAVLIHDVIPLDFPQYQRPGTPDRFRAMLRRVRGAADLIIYNSHHTQERAEHYMASWGGLPPGVVAHLGVDVPQPDMAALPPGLDPDSKWFVMLGTIEPRKGHDLLLDVWQDLQADIVPDTPQLLIIGARGWNNMEVFARLDNLPPDGPVQELSGLGDAAVTALLAGSQGLLFPSRAEGFGLPPVEAAALGVRVLCSDLPVIREVLGDIPVYVSEMERYQWHNAIKSIVQEQERHRPLNGGSDFSPTTWTDHFNAVLRFI
ncbi:MAG: glycosyltransferase involved in cell wall biosynthesis [Paracoccaceae bacterium]|jgi:glycosyltransferase involved in cell wall biosynthesis